jgi:hypothetical protein
VLPYDAYPPGYQNSRGRQEPAKTREKQPVNFSFFSFRAQVQQCDFWEFLHKNLYAGFLLPVLSDIKRGSLHGKRFKRGAGLQMRDLL